MLDTNEVPQEVNTSAEATTMEEVLIETMDSFDNDAPPLLQRSVSKTVNSASTDTPTIDETTCTSLSDDTLTGEAPVSDNNEITIKLKFINDDQKLVTGSLKEMLGEFKR